MLRAFERIGHWLGARRVRAHSPEPGPQRGRVDHVVILDGTMSTLDPGMETNAGLTYRLLYESGPSLHLSLFYESGIQWDSWRRSSDVVRGRGINRQIRRAYGFLATRYRPGDRIFLFGYSRGAFAVRSLAGIIDQVGLLRREEATERNVLLAYRHYQARVRHDAARAFSRLFCHPSTEIEMVGVWDTVKALGLRLPLLWRLSEQEHDFHNHNLGPAIRRGYHALALHETRVAFAPVLWTCPPDWQGNVEQVWFRGAHGDVGGQLGDFAPARPLANIPLVWMLERAEICGLPLPENWRDRFPCDPYAPMLGTMRGLGKLFVLRARRRVGRDRSEAIHPSAAMVDPKAALGQRAPAS